MLRLRFSIVVLVLWATLIFNIDRIDILALNIPTTLYVVLALGLTLLMLFPSTDAIRFEIIIIPFLAAYILMRANGIFSSTIATIPSVVTESVVLIATLWLGRKISARLENLEKVVENIGYDLETNRIHDMIEGESLINDELFRARKYERPVTLLYIKVPSIARLRRIHRKTLQYQLSLEQRYYKLRIARIIESMIYRVDTMVWHGDDIIVCLPETEKVHADKLVMQITEVIKATVLIKIPIGTSSFPKDGLIYTDLVKKAKSALKYHSSDEDDDNDKNNKTSLRLPEETSDPMLITHPKRSQQEKQTLSAFQKMKQKAHHVFFSKLRGIDFHVRGLQSLRDWRDSLVPYEVKELGYKLRNNPRLNKWADQISLFLGDDVRLLPTRQRESNNTGDHRIYYDPDYWVNRIPAQSQSSRRIYHHVKYAMDIAIILIASPAILLVCAIVAIIIKLEDGGSIFFAQDRVGLGGHKFKMYKFRSMVENAEQRYEELGVRVNARGETVDANGNKLTYDPRITRLGGFIRKTSLDELPQLWNVVRGEMSLVGPRPTSFGVDKYQLFHTQRLNVKPGITGLWQIHDRGDTDFDNRLVWDIKYIDKYSFFMDINILFRTIDAVIIKKKGAR